jgi:membrane-associated phospholipid phosphatase
VKQNRRSFLWVVVLAIAGLAAGCAFWLDPSVRDWILQHRSRGLETFMRNVSRFGDWPEHVALGLMFAAVAWLRHNKKWTRIFLSMLIACALAGAAARVIKIATGRARPSVKTEAVWNGPRLSEKFHAFPSGHVAASTAFFGVLFLASRRIGSAFMLIPILIGFSRMYVAAHYLSDVVCAAILGVACAVITTRLLIIRDSESAAR